MLYVLHVYMHVGEMQARLLLLWTKQLNFTPGGMIAPEQEAVLRHVCGTAERRWNRRTPYRQDLCLEYCSCPSLLLPRYSSSSVL